MKTHNLKLSIEFCDAVLSGEKTFEVRKNDRGFQTGDLIRFIPTDGTSYRSSDGTVREHAKHEISGHTYKITYILNGWGIKNGYVVLKEDNILNSRFGKKNHFQVPAGYFDQLTDRDRKSVV